MMQHDLSCWPLVLSVSHGQPDVQTLHDYCDAWTSWLERGERFALLQVFMDEAAHSHPKGGAKIGQNWLAANTEAFQKQVLAAASVAPAALVTKMNRMKTERLYGEVPKQAFAEVPTALDWLMPLLAAGIPALDASDLKARALRQYLHIAQSLSTQ